MSSPTELAEAKASDLIAWTEGRALAATGIPPETVNYNGVAYDIRQANNALIYPGLGFGAISVGASRVTDRMFSRAAHSLGGIVDTSTPGAAVLPPVSKLTKFSGTAAIAVATEAVKAGLNTLEAEDPAKSVRAHKWQPIYRKY